MSHTVNNWTLSLTRYKHIHLFSCSSLPPLVLWCQQRKLIFKKGWESAGNCPSLWGFAATCGAFTETWPLFHLSLPSVTCLQQTELTRADLPPLNRLPPLVSALSQRLPIPSCPSSSWVISRTLELLPSIDGTATGGMLSLGELSVVRGNSLSIKRAGKGIVVFTKGIFVRHSWAWELLSVSFQGRSSLGEDQVMGRHLTTQTVPQTSKPSKC